MHRRKFLQVSTTGLLTTAIVGFPKSNKAQTPEGEGPKTYYWRSGNEAFELEMYNEPLNNFSKAPISMREVTIKEVAELFAGSTSEVNHQYRITAVKMHPEYLARKLVTIQCVDENGTVKAGVFGKESLTLDVLPNAVVYLTDTRTNETFTLKVATLLDQQEDTNDSDEEYVPDCFLTTACVEHKGLADDGVELNTLRAFREEYMRPTAEGQALLERYYIDGPAILKAVEQQANPAEYYEHMYQHLVRPSLALIAHNHKAEAMAYYRDYVLAIKSHLQLS